MNSPLAHGILIVVAIWAGLVHYTMCSYLDPGVFQWENSHG